MAIPHLSWCFVLDLHLKPLRLSNPSKSDRLEMRWAFTSMWSGRILGISQIDTRSNRREGQRCLYLAHGLERRDYSVKIRCDDYWTSILMLCSRFASKTLADDSCAPNKRIRADWTLDWNLISFSESDETRSQKSRWGRCVHILYLTSSSSVDLVVNEAIGGLQTSNRFIDNQIHRTQSSLDDGTNLFFISTWCVTFVSHWLLSRLFIAIFRFE
jgi:hypothetical protein